MPAATVRVGLDTAPYTPSPPDSHRGKSNQSPPPSKDYQQSRSLPETPIHQRRMAAQPSEWSPGGPIAANSVEKRADWHNGSDPNGKKTGNRRWWSLRAAIPSGPRPFLPSRTSLTYFVFSLLISVNIYIIAQSFTGGPELRQRMMHLGERKDEHQASLEDMDRKSFDLDSYYGSRDSPLFCDLCPSGDEFCKSIGWVLSYGGGCQIGANCPIT